MSYAQPRQYSVLQGQGVPDGVLVRQAQTGDQRAFEFLVSRYRHLLVSYIRVFLNDGDQVSDVLQQVYLQLYVSLPLLLTNVSLKGWLFQVARNRCLDELRRRRRRAETPFSTLAWEDREEDLSPIEAIPDPDPLPEEVAERIDLYCSLQEAIAALPPKFRPIVRLRCFRHLTFAEIGRMLNMPKPTVKTYFYRTCVVRSRVVRTLQTSRSVKPVDFFYAPTNASLHSVSISCRKRATSLPHLNGVKRSFLRCHAIRKRINMQQLIGNFRTMVLFRGIAAVLFGILTLVWPNLSLTVLVYLFGVFAVISGITAMAAALRNREEQGWGFLLFEGILGILAGVVALVWPGITALAFLYLLAAWAIITGVMELVAPLGLPMSGRRTVLMVLAGLASIVFGVLIAAQPSSGLLAVVWLIGVYAIVFGVMYIGMYFQSRSLASSLA